MPRTTERRGFEMPSTVARSPQHAQDVFAATLRSAVDEYGEGERARRTAFASLKHSFEKVGDHWEPKHEKGPSDEGAQTRGRRTRGGVDANATKEHLLDVARRLEVRGRSRMTKEQLVEAIEKANARETRRSREEGR